MPRTRSSHHIAARVFANFGFKSGTRIIDFASVPLIPRFASSVPQGRANLGIGTLGTFLRPTLWRETRVMGRGDIAVGVVWIAVLAAAISSGLKMAHSIGPLGSRAPFPPTNVAIFLLVFFFVASAAGVFFLRRVLFQGRWAGRLIDRVWGLGTWATMVVRLKPTALMIAMCCTLGTVGLASTYAQSQSWTAYFNSTFALSVSLGLVAAYWLSRKYPPALP